MHRQASSIASLSDELLLNIFSFLGYKDLVTLSASSRFLSDLSSDPQLWKRLFIQHFIKPRRRGRRSRSSSHSNPSVSDTLPTLSGLRSLISSQQQDASTHRDIDGDTSEEEIISEALQTDFNRTIVSRDQDSDWKPYQETSTANRHTSLPDPDLDLGWASSFPSSSSSNVEGSNAFKPSDSLPQSNEITNDSRTNQTSSDYLSTAPADKDAISKKFSSSYRHNPSSPAIVGLPSKFYQPHLRNRISSNGFSSPRVLSSSSTSKPVSVPSAQGSSNSQTANGDDQFDLDADDVFDDLRNEGLDWKALFIVSSNWQKGNFLVSELLNEPTDRFRDRSGDESDLRDQIEEEDSKGIQEEQSVKDQSQINPPRASVPSRASNSQSTPVSFKSLKSSSPNWEPESETGPSRALTLVQASHSTPLVFTARRTPMKMDFKREVSKIDFPKVQIYHSESGKDKKSADPHSGRTLTSSLGSIVPGSKTLSKLTSSEGIIEARQEISITEIKSDSIDRSQGLLKSLGGFTAEQEGEDQNELRSREGGERLLVCYESRNYSAVVVFRVWVDQHQDFKIEYSEEASSFTDRHHSNSSSDKIVASAFSSPVLVTCSVDFKVKIYRIVDSTLSSSSCSSRLDLVQKMTSFASEWPASFQLKQIPVFHQQTNKRRKPNSTTDLISNRSPGSDLVFKLSISFCSPSYPTSFSVSLQEVIIHLPTLDSKDDDCSGNLARITTRHATATNSYSYSPMESAIKKQSRGNFLERGSTSGSSWIFDDHQVLATDSLHHPQEEGGGGSKGKNKILSVTFDSDWIVIGRRDNLLECYEVLGGTRSLTSNGSGKPSNTRNQEALTLVHRSVVYGHLGSVQSVALDDGRVVSGGSDSSIIVWSLVRKSSREEENGRAIRSRCGDWKSMKDRREEREAFNSGNLGKRKRLQEEEDQEEDDDDDDDNKSIPQEDQPPEISRIVTLRTPNSKALTFKSNSTPSSISRVPTLHDLLVQSRELKSSSISSSSRPNVIRWVGSSFDKILSVMDRCDDPNPNPNPNPTDPRGADEMDSRRDDEKNLDREQVQIWSFSG